MRALVLSLLMAAGAARAEFLNGNMLYERLNEPVGSVGYSLAMGYVAGVHDARAGVEICAPSSLTIGQSSDMVRQWLRDNPAERHRTADQIVVHVLSSRFPCKQKQGGVSTL